MSGGFKKGKLNPYQKTAIQTASKEELVLLLYNGAIKYTTNAIDFLNNKNLPDASKNICRAQAIIVELLNSLNFEIGGEIAKNLEYLYSVMVDNLTVANFEHVKEPLELNLRILDKLRTAWEGVLAQVKPAAVNK
ncbi:MAG: flagellar export chaperone FliS [Deltaproteobacteria bacterium]|nr:flagellar export chaperone FliS [Deltaproteobacteria bacterium]